MRSCPNLKHPRLHKKALLPLMSWRLFEFRADVLSSVGAFFAREKSEALGPVMDGRIPSQLFGVLPMAKLATGAAFSRFRVDGEAPARAAGVDVADAFDPALPQPLLPWYFGHSKIRAGDLGVSVSAARQQRAQLGPPAHWIQSGSGGDAFGWAFDSDAPATPSTLGSCGNCASVTRRDSPAAPTAAKTGASTFLETGAAGEATRRDCEARALGSGAWAVSAEPPNDGASERSAALAAFFNEIFVDGYPSEEAPRARSLADLILSSGPDGGVDRELEAMELELQRHMEQYRQQRDGGAAAPPEHPRPAPRRGSAEPAGARGAAQLPSGAAAADPEAAAGELREMQAAAELLEQAFPDAPVAEVGGEVAGVGEAAAGSTGGPWRTTAPARLASPGAAPAEELPPAEDGRPAEAAPDPDAERARRAGRQAAGAAGPAGAEAASGAREGGGRAGAASRCRGLLRHRPAAGAESPPARSPPGQRQGPPQHRPLPLRRCGPRQGDARKPEE
ncbi:unnamed protein product [Prorocentrum cordatum]|uniref:Uncharacterized protein n=1 Tax=Prorocentrum cordatum TaxID=2364126 RepID=A0ABN9TDR4_9DINO|nr:unnamed protein product [Polarella glacialis]